MSIQHLQPIFNDPHKKAERKLFVRHFYGEDLTLGARPHIELKIDKYEDSRLSAQIKDIGIMVSGASINQILVEMDKSIIQRWRDLVNPGKANLSEKDMQHRTSMMNRFFEISS